MEGMLDLNDITAEELHRSLITQIPANTYLELFYLMHMIIEHTLEGRNNK